MLEVGESDAPATASGKDPAAGHGRFAWAALLGSLIALGLFVALLAGPGPDLLDDNGLLGSFYDVQAQALLDGHLYVEPEEVSFEGFRIDGRTHIYFGMVPTLLRLPVLALTDGLDGRLTQLSMLLAFCVLLASSAWLHWLVRQRVRPDAAVERADQIASFLLQVAVGAGVPLYLAGRSVVYHEAEMWGAALAVAAIAAVVGLAAKPSPSRIAWAGLLAALAVSARFSVGLGPVLALAVLGAGFAARLWSTRRGGRLAELLGSFGPQGPYRGGGRTLALLAAVVLVSLAPHAAVNTARFGTPFGIPIAKQVHSKDEPSRRAALAANNGTIFGLKFVPTTLLQAVRPDAVGRVRAFPFVGLPTEPATVIGEVRFDTIEPSLSAPTSMPALCALMLVGLVPLARRRALRPLLAVLLATASGFALTLTIAFVTTRYLADLLPFLVLGGAIGLQAVLEGTSRRGLVLGGLAALTAVAIAVNGGAGLISQRLLYEATEEERAAFVRTQDDIDRFLGRRPSGILAGQELPVPASGDPGDLFVLDRCASLHVQGLQRDWLPVERTERAGVHRLRVRFPRSTESTPEALLTIGTGSRRVVVGSRGSAAGTTIAVRVGRRTVDVSRPLSLPPSRPVDVVVSLDFFSGAWFTAVDVGGRRAVTTPTPDVRRFAAVLGADPGGLPRFSGRVERIASPATACRTVASRAGLLGPAQAG